MINHNTISQEPVDEFIDNLVEGIETSLPQSNLLKYWLCFKTGILMSPITPDKIVFVCRQPLRMARICF